MTIYYGNGINGFLSPYVIHIYVTFARKKIYIYNFGPNSRGELEWYKGLWVVKYQ